MARKRHYPTSEELDKKVKLELEPDEAIRLIMETGDHPDGRGGSETEPD